MRQVAQGGGGGLTGPADQNALQADPAPLGSSAGPLRTSMYIGALFAAAANATFFPAGATGSGLHAMAWVLLGVAAGSLVLCAADRSLVRSGGTPGDGASPASERTSRGSVCRRRVR
ncbi:hypothetical protein K6168_10925 [Streptomyces sp. FB2]|uniref:hypothetical protein n=1 Tax=Streptomyces sp. FB2 TaxID=2902454 RepID=UPI001F377629|nr:hypothetical protein [Streptomyces sp. FB2]MCF2536173.1 hypothetical protein [Streptomyces sp. FB2]